MLAMRASSPSSTPPSSLRFADVTSSHSPDLMQRLDYDAWAVVTMISSPLRVSLRIQGGIAGAALDAAVIGGIYALEAATLRANDHIRSHHPSPMGRHQPGRRARWCATG